MEQLNLFEQDFLMVKEAVQKKSNDDHDPLLRKFLDELGCTSASEAIDKLGYPIAFRQAFKHFKQQQL